MPPALDAFADVAPAFAPCWQMPRGLAALENVEVTIRFSVTRDGRLSGPPRVVYATSPPGSAGREVLTRSALEAIRACTPLRITPGFGAAIAGRPLTIRFTYKGPRGRGA